MRNKIDTTWKNDIIYMYYDIILRAYKKTTKNY